MGLVDIILWLVLSVLAVYRLATDFAWEDGPFDLYSLVRGAVITFARGRSMSWLEDGIQCPICISFWLSFIFAVPAFWFASHLYILFALAIAGAVSYMVRSK